MINLWDDQTVVVKELKGKLGFNKSVLLQAATGFGKSVCAAYMIGSIEKAGKTAVYVVPRRELLRQMCKTFTKYDIEYGIISAGYQEKPHKLIQIATTDTFIQRIRAGSKYEFDFVFLDESHYGGAKNDAIVEHYQKARSYVIPMTATPNKRILDYVDDVVCGPSIEWLIDNKRLCEYRVFGPSNPDFSDIKLVNGEYSNKEMSEVMERDSVLIGDAVKHYKEHAMNKRTLCFCYSVEHSKKTAELFCDAGIGAAHIDSKTPDKERIKIITEFATGKIDVLCSVDLCIFGFDLSSQVDMDVTVEVLIDLAPTKSLQKQLQKWGRVFRMKDFPAAIFDHVNNIREHGFPDDDRDWTKQDDEDEGVRDNYEKTIPTRVCPECYFAHKPSPACPNCGCVYDTNPRKIAEVDGVLKEYDIEQEKLRRDAEKDKEQQVKDAKKIARVNKIERNRSLTGADRIKARDDRKAWLKMSGKPAWLVAKILDKEGLA